jgi:hypothetical protein
MYDILIFFSIGIRPKGKYRLRSRLPKVAGAFWNLRDEVGRNLDLQIIDTILDFREVQAALRSKIETDIYVDEILVKVKHLTLVDYAEGMVALMKARQDFQH